MTRRARAVALSVVSIVSVASVSGCAAVDAVLGIREAPKANAASAALTVDQAKRILTRVHGVVVQARALTPVRFRLSALAPSRGKV